MAPGHRGGPWRSGGLRCGGEQSWEPSRHTADPVNFGNTSLVSCSPEQEASSPDQLGNAADPWPRSPLQKELSQWYMCCWGRRGARGQGPQASPRENQEVGPSCWASEIS